MKKILTLAAIVVAIGGCTGQKADTNSAPVTINSLAGTSAITDIRPADAMPVFPTRGAALERSFSDQPPLIPHKDDYKITLDKNGCLSCHSWEKAERMKATPVAKSHVIDDKGNLNGQNYFCTQCHVAQAENKAPLVENKFSNQ
ncbi:MULTISPECIES: nitrate reductase cytochrome c-type subunit NapB [Shewanella]|uniref:Periplasmic nitrate reductase, electron transfer subunit n=1 Tax=Shewanella putrefaciens (strain CN-32 / ATCC BAA-453) TaxID=319224 RepID=A4YA80_SHEPC|nr:MULTISPECIES: nitrate reductase cytochrome c-type subunit NapB [Shewanella]ABM23643.1 periplasmic nitrate reductase subunit NapB [Shewanella sp. W3-18-1]QGS48770.1 nitrate reductase cytochrome c-type subunit; periplasmic nitrate reductase electron transfer subunit [Shewanella putrefaciens]CAD6364910.1 Periplasmic nitrate reductase, electron transfer subunit [Shewanella hafniensis]